MLTIEGSLGEGGGQILRTSLSLAALTGQDVTIENIRPRRDKPGLRPQHLTSALAVADICGAEVKGIEVGSQRLVFRPGKVRPGNYEFDVSRIRASAGSVGLVLQTVLWPLAMSGRACRVILRGGTHVPHAPTFNYISETFLPAVARMGLICHLEMPRAGYYPAGGGELRLEIRPAGTLQPLSLMGKDAPRAELLSSVSNLPRSIAERQLATGLQRTRALGMEPETEITEYPSPGKGTVFFASVSGAQTLGGFQSLGELRKRAETVADEACDEMERFVRSGAGADPHLADQMVIPFALAGAGSELSTSEITLHLLTNVSVVERFLPVNFHISAGLGEPGILRRT